MTTYHLVHTLNTWTLTQEGDQGSVVIDTHDGLIENDTKEQALIRAGLYLNHLGKTAWLRVHNEDGSFQEALNYPTQGQHQHPAPALNA